MFNLDLREEIGRLRVEEGRTIKSLSEEFGVSVGSVSRWSHEYEASPKPRTREKDMTNLRIELENVRKENAELRAQLEHARIEADVLKEILRSFVPGGESVSVAL
jgi:transposase